MYLDKFLQISRRQLVITGDRKFRLRRLNCNFSPNVLNISYKSHMLSEESRVNDRHREVYM